MSRHSHFNGQVVSAYLIACPHGLSRNGLGGGSPCLCSRDDNPRARFSVRPGMMVTKGDPQASTDVRQRRRVDIPDSPGKPDSALKRVRGRAQTSPFTTRIQNGAVETGIMCREKLHAGKPLAKRWPQLPKCRGVNHVTPRDAVQIREHEVLAWRTNVVEGTIDDSPAFNSYECDGTRAIAPVVRGLEVDRGKRRGSRQQGNMLSSHLVFQPCRHSASSHPTTELSRR